MQPTPTEAALQRHIPVDALPWVPEHFYAECGSVLPRWEMRHVLSPEGIASAVDEIMRWPLRVADLRGLFLDGWSYRTQLTLADALYVVLADHLKGQLLTDDQRLARMPNPPAQILHL